MMEPESFILLVAEYKFGCRSTLPYVDSKPCENLSPAIVTKILSRVPEKLFEHGVAYERSELINIAPGKYLAVYWEIPTETRQKEIMEVLTAQAPNGKCGLDVNSGKNVLLYSTLIRKLFWPATKAEYEFYKENCIIKSHNQTTV